VSEREREDWNAKMRRAAEDEFNLSYFDEAKLWLAWRVLQRKVIPKMLTLISKFLWDETAFIRYTRTILAGLGMAMQEGVIPTGIDGGGKWGALLVVLAFFLGAGDKNQPPEKIKAIANGG